MSAIMATAQQVADARAWAEDCTWVEDDVDLLPDAAIVRGVQRHYAGGWDGFLADSARVPS